MDLRMIHFALLWLRVAGKQENRLCLKKSILYEIMGIEKIPGRTGLVITGKNYLEGHEHGYKRRSSVWFVV